LESEKKAESFLTLREKLVELLSKCEEPLSVSEIATILGIDRGDKKVLYEALEHVAKTIRRRSQNRQMLVMIPPVCKSCGYVFKDLDKPRKPSKCPRCKSERISEPKFKIITVKV